MFIENPYGFIYITTNMVNGKRYVGQKKFDNKLAWKNYLGSGVALKNAIQKYGRKNFRKDIIAIAYTADELSNLEISYIQMLDAVNSTNFYNIAVGGEGHNFFGSDKWNKTRYIYCIETKRAYKSCVIASNIENENHHTIYNKCKHFYNYKSIKKGLHYCFIEDLYKVTDIKTCSSSVPIVHLETGKLYPSWNIANKLLDFNVTARKVLPYEKYLKWKSKGKDLSDRFLILKDYFDNICEYTT